MSAHIIRGIVSDLIFSKKMTLRVLRQCFGNVSYCSLHTIRKYGAFSLSSYSKMTSFGSNSLSQRHLNSPCNVMATNITHARGVHSGGKHVVLGIETSCDDTGVAVVDDSGNVLGEALFSQTAVHVESGGIIPPVARDLHKEHIEQAVRDALAAARITIKDVDAIATTVKPGLVMSLNVGVSYSKQLVRDSGKPFIPIHHMEAHALTVRMIERVDFPFLVLLASGGHCLLAVARDIDDFLLLGKCLDDAPGEAFDKTARRWNLKSLPHLVHLSGGAAIELLARDGNPLAVPLTPVMSHMRNCDFSFAGIKQKFAVVTRAEEDQHGIESGTVLPNVADMCASFQAYVLHHLCQRVQRALVFCDMKSLLPESKKTLVVSGGVASNQFLRSGLERLCSLFDCKVLCPPPKLCTDNGIMIAWNGMEKWKRGVGVVNDLDSVQVKGRYPFGTDIRDEVSSCSIKLRKIKLF